MAVAVKPFRVCRNGVEELQRGMGRLGVKASMEDGEGEVSMNKPNGSGKKAMAVAKILKAFEETGNGACEEVEGVAEIPVVGEEH